MAESRIASPWRQWSPRARLTVVASAVIAVVLGVASLGAVLALRHSLLSSVDTAARDDARDVGAELTNNVGPLREVAAPVPDAVVQVVFSTGTIVGSAGAPARPIIADRGSPAAPVTATGPLPIPQSADSYRIAAFRPHGSEATVLVALPSDDVTDAVHQLRNVLVIGAPLVLVVLTLFFWWVTGRTLAPVEAMHRRQREFVGDAAHELRTPLAGLRAELELARDDPTVDVRPQVPQLLGEVQRMSGVVDALLALTRAEQARVPKVAVDLDDVVLASVQRVRERAGTVVDATRVTAAQIQGDRMALGQLVDNLLANAARHAASKVTVHLHVDRGAAVLVVADDGPGIPAADRAHVFDRFARLDPARSRSDGGVGLGLAIVRAVTRAHGGDVAVEDNKPGARFVVRIPAAHE